LAGNAAGAKQKKPKGGEGGTTSTCHKGHSRSPGFPEEEKLGQGGSREPLWGGELGRDKRSASGWREKEAPERGEVTSFHRGPA